MNYSGCAARPQRQNITFWRRADGRVPFWHTSAGPKYRSVLDRRGRRRDAAALQGQDGELHAAAHVQLVEDGREVVLDRLLRDACRRGDIAVAQAAGDRGDDFTFAWAEVSAHAPIDGPRSTNFPHPPVAENWDSGPRSRICRPSILKDAMTPGKLLPHGADACPGPEQLAAYVDGMLAPADRTDLDRHLAGCADCREVVGDTREALGTLRDGRRPGRWMVTSAS